MYATDRSFRTPTPWRSYGRTLAATLLGTALVWPGAGAGLPGATPAPPRIPPPLPPVDAHFGSPGRRAEPASGANPTPPGAAPPSPAPMNPPVAFGLCGAFLAGLLALALWPRRLPAPPSGEPIAGEEAP
jgi:hypothetical protein